MSVAGSTNPMNVLRARIGAARLPLSSQNDPQKKAEASATQAASVIETIKSTVSSAEDRATVRCLLATVDWCPHDRLEMSAHASVPPKSASETAAAPTMGRQWTMQNYSSVVYALTQHEWDQLLATMVALSSKMDVLVWCAINLWCRRPSEPTFKAWAALMIVVSKAPEYNDAMPAFSKEWYKSELKSRFTKAQKR